MRREWSTLLIAVALGSGSFVTGCGEDKHTEDAGMDAAAVDGGLDAAPDASGPDASGPDGAADASADAGPSGLCGREGWGSACGPASRLLLSASIFSSSGSGSSRLALLDLSDGSVSWSDPITDDGDVLATRVGCTPVLLRRTTGEIALQDPDHPFTTVRTLQAWPPDVTPANWGYNPWAIAATGPFQAAVAPYAVNELTLVDGTCEHAMARVGAVDLSGFMLDADGDGTPDDADGSVDASSVVVHDGRAYVTLGRSYYDASSMGLAYAGGALVAVVDLDGNSLVDMDPATDGVQGIELGYQNPVGGAYLAEVGGRTLLYVGAVGDHFMADGAIVPVQLPEGTVQAPLFEETRSERIVDFVVDDATDQAFVLVAPILSDNPMSTSLIAISLGDGTRRTVVSGTAGTRLALADAPASDGRLVAMLEGTHLRTFSVTDGMETTPSGGIDVTVPGAGGGSVYYGSLVAIP